MENIEQPLSPTPPLSSPPPSIKKTKKPFFIFLIILIIIALTLLGIIFAKGLLVFNKTENLSLQTTTENTLSPTDIPKQVENNNLVSLDDTWNLYTNEGLGFSMKIPKTAYLFGGSCADGNLGNDLVPIKVFSDEKETYITAESFYEYPQDNLCQKTVASLSIIQQRANQWKDNNYENDLFVPSYWRIIVAKVENDTELENFVKTNYGSSCTLGEKKLSASGIYDVKILGDGLGLDTTKCPINFAIALKYSPDLKKAATWGIGQAIIFSSFDYKETYDTEILDSFKFIN
jgi:hypothetical protein